LAAIPESAHVDAVPTFRRGAFVAAIALAVLAFLLFTDNLFTPFNVTVWVISLGLLLWSLWMRRPDAPSFGWSMRRFLARRTWELSINRWTLIVLVASAIVIFFRVYHLQQTPGEPFSDHAEKLLDVFDISQGKTSIFFPRNTGREAFQMYWTLLISWIFGTGLSFLSLKIGTVLIGLLTLPYIYLLARKWRCPRGPAGSLPGRHRVLAECNRSHRPEVSVVSAVYGAADVLPGPRSADPQPQ